MKLTEGEWPSVPSAAKRIVSMVRSLGLQGLKPTGHVAGQAALIPVMIQAWLGLGLLAQFLAAAAPAESVAASSPDVFTVDLNYQETEEVLLSRAVGIKLQKAPFPKEPALPGQNVFRGSLLWGPRPDQATPFIWDKGRGRLLLDLNRNRDLTDDPKGIFASAVRNDNQSFTNIHLAIPTSAGDRPLRLQLYFYSYGAGSVNVYAGLGSYWDARVSRSGADWQFGLVEGLFEGKASAAPQYLLVRSWADRQRPFNLASSSPDFCEFTTNLFFGNQAYALDCRYDAHGDLAKYHITFKEQAPRMGELQVTGTGLHRVILTASRGPTVLLDQPRGTVKLPVESYSLEEIWLRQGDVEVHRLKAGRINIEDQRPASLVAGGPLTNSVILKSQGDNLQLNYQLLGADGGAYQFPRTDEKHPPEFAVFQGTNRLASGKFQYG